MSKWPYIAYGKKLPFFFYNFQKMACRYLQNYANRKKSKTYHQKETPCISYRYPSHRVSYIYYVLACHIHMADMHVCVFSLSDECGGYTCVLPCQMNVANIHVFYSGIWMWRINVFYLVRWMWRICLCFTTLDAGWIRRICMPMFVVGIHVFFSVRWIWRIYMCLLCKDECGGLYMGFTLSYECGKYTCVLRRKINTYVFSL